MRMETISIIARNSSRKPTLDDNSVLRSFSTFILRCVNSSCCLRKRSKFRLLASTCLILGLAIGLVEIVVSGIFLYEPSSCCSFR